MRHVTVVRVEPVEELGGLGPAVLELDPGVDVFRGLAHDHDVDVLEAGADTGVRLAGPDLRVEVERDAQTDVDRAEALADRSGDRALERHPVAADRLERLVRQWVAAVPRHHVGTRLLDVPLERDAGGLEDAPRRLGQLRTDSVAGNQGDAVGDSSKISTPLPRPASVPCSA